MIPTIVYNSTQDIIASTVDVVPSPSTQYSYRGNNNNVSGIPVDNTMKSLTESTSNVLTITNDNRALLNDCSIQVKESSDTQSGFLSSTNFAKFDDKQDKIANPTNNNIVFTNAQGQTIDNGYSVNNFNPFSNPSAVQLTSVLTVKNYADLKAPLEVLRKYWDATSDPTLSPFSATVAGNATYKTSIRNNYFVHLVNGRNQTGYFNFDAGANYPNFKFVVYYKILNTNKPADLLWFFANGTQTSVGQEDETQGLMFATDYYDSSNYNYKSRISIFNGTSNTSLLAYSLNGIDDVNESFIKMTMIRYGSEISISLENPDFGIMTRRVTSAIQTTGTRFGVGARTGGNSMSLEIKSMSLSSYES